MSKFNEFPVHDEVHVISDIHMGGEPDFQILRETERLSGYIGWVGKQNPKGRVALVLNGDVFDTLAEDIEGYVAVTKAVETVEGIMNRPSFSGIWNALAKFVGLKQRHLVFVIGNHDIEMAFPTVQRLILSRLAGDDLARRARIEFSTTGAGYTCTIGTAQVYCTHGNEVDAWNYNRYEDLAKVSRRLNVGRSLNPNEWCPNAGTRMVKEVMNEVKETYKWIDLLKPENTAAVGTLVVLDPSQISKITKLISLVGKKTLETIEVDQRLSTDGFQSQQQIATSPVDIDQILGPNVRAGMGGEQSAGTQSVDDMLLAVENNLGQPNDQVVAPEAVLGAGQLIWDRLTGWITGVGKDEALRRALQDWLKDDKSFEITNKDETFKAVSAATGSTIDFIVTGHTHLERAIDMGSNRYYFNCGTWIRLLQFTDAMLKDIDSFKPVYNLLIDEQGRLELIDAAVFPDGLGKDSPFVLNQTSAVSIKNERGKVVGRLTHIEGDGTGAPREIKKFVRT